MLDVDPEDAGSMSSRIDVSRRGDMLVFSGECEGYKNLFLLNLKSHAVSRLTDTIEYENYLAFSPMARIRTCLLTESIFCTYPKQEANSVLQI